MATRLADGRYQARKRMENGTRLAGYGKTEQEADADLAAKVSQWHLIPSTVHPVETLHDIAHADWKPLLAHLRPLSRKKYEAAYANWVRDAIGHLEPRAVTVHHIQALVNVCAAETSPSTAIFIRSVCHQLLRCAEDRGLVVRNVARLARAPKRAPKRERVITVEQAQELLEHVAGSELAAPVFFGLVLGLRRGEIAGLKWSDLDRQTGALRIVRQRQAIRPHGVIETDLKTTGSRRVLRLRPALVAEIDRRGNLDSPYICTYRGEPWVPDTITEKWNAAKPETFTDWHFHDLRHGAAGLLYGLGCDILEIAAILGHTRPDVTLTYTSALDSKRAKALESMEALFPVDA